MSKISAQSLAEHVNCSNVFFINSLFFEKKVPTNYIETKKATIGTRCLLLNKLNRISI